MLLHEEVPGWRQDPAALLADLRTHVLPLPEVSGPGGWFGGWSLTSGDGDYRDGWQRGHEVYKAGPGGGVAVDAELARRLFPKPPEQYTVPTPLCVGSLREAVDAAVARGLRPYRARVSRLGPGAAMCFHVDSATEGWRLHVPIATNPGCYFHWRAPGGETRLRMPADGRAWLVRTDVEHRFVNEGGEDRYHLIMSVVRPSLTGRPAHA